MHQTTGLLSGDFAHDWSFCWVFSWSFAALFPLGPLRPLLGAVEAAGSTKTGYSCLAWSFMTVAKLAYARFRFKLGASISIWMLPKGKQFLLVWTVIDPAGQEPSLISFSMHSSVVEAVILFTADPELGSSVNNLRPSSGLRWTLKLHSKSAFALTCYFCT